MEDERGNTICSKCGSKIEGGYCNCITDKHKEYVYIVKTTCFDDVVESATTSREAKYKAYKACKAAGYKYTWLEFQKIVVSAKRFKSKDLEC